MSAAIHLENTDMIGHVWISCLAVEERLSIARQKIRLIFSAN